MSVEPWYLPLLICRFQTAQNYFELMLSFSQLSAVTPGRVLSCSVDRPITTLVLDSRKSPISEGVIFFAIKGDRHDGHRYLNELYQKGVRQFIVEESVQASLFP